MFRPLALRQSEGHENEIRSDEGLMLETPAFQLITVANLHFQLS